MKRALFLAYHFPPVGGSGVQRTVKFLRYLGDFGWTAAVLAGPSSSRGDDDLYDATLEAELPRGLAIYRISEPEPPKSTGLRARGERWLGIRTRWSSWWVERSVQLARTVGDEFDVVYASMSPFQSAEAASRIAAELGVPWVADLRDPWALDEMRAYPTGFHRRLELRRMRRLLGAAETIVMNTHEASVALRQSFPELARKRVVYITNGFDPADFARPAPQAEDDAFRIVHVGTLHTEQGRQHRRTMPLRRLIGGTLGDVDIYTRSHVFLLEAVRRLIRREPELASLIEVHLGGSLSPDDRRAIGDDGRVREYGYLVHEEAIALLRSADLLFLPMHDLPPGRRARIVPGKTYEYLAARRPILGALPEGDARDLLDRSPDTYVCSPGDVDGIAEAIRTAIARRATGAAARSAAPDELRRYERRELTAQLCAALDEATTGSATPLRVVRDAVGVA